MCVCICVCACVCCVCVVYVCVGLILDLLQASGPSIEMDIGAEYSVRGVLKVGRSSHLSEYLLELLSFQSWKVHRLQ